MLYFVKLKDSTCKILHFYHFIYFSAIFYPIWMKYLPKFRENTGLHTYCLFGPKLVPTSPRTAVLSGLFLKNRKDQVHGPGKTGPSVLYGP